MMLFYDSYCRLFIDYWEQCNLFDSYLFFQDQPSQALWYQVAKNSASQIDPTTIFDRNFVEVEYIPQLKLPLAKKEFHRWTSLSKEWSQAEDFLELLKEKSVYDRTIDEITSNATLLNFYYENQLSLLYLTQQFELPYSIVHLLVKSNPKRTTLDRLIQLFAHTDELIEILNIMQQAWKVIGEEKLTVYLSQQMRGEPPINVIYSLVNDRLYSSHSSSVVKDFEFVDQADPFVEVSLMNIIELLLSPQDIIRRGHFEETISLLSAIHSSVRRLDHYRVINLQKLVSMIHLLRCLQTSSPETQAIQIFQERCKEGFLFETCDDIHRYLDRFRTYMGIKEKESIFLKLELQFLQQWSIDHADDYLITLDAINRTDGELWKYSSDAIATVIDEYQLGLDLESADEEPDPDVLALAEKLKMLAENRYQIHRIIANRLLMDHLADHPLTDQSVVKPLNDHLSHFKQCIESVNRLKLDA